MPDQPTSLTNVPEVTQATQVGLEWLAPSFDGGSSLLDYQVWFAEQGSSFQLFADSLPGLSYTATGLTQGVTYEFKVEARNAYGLGFFSNTVTVLSA